MVAALPSSLRIASLNVVELDLCSDRVGQKLDILLRREVSQFVFDASFPSHLLVVVQLFTFDSTVMSS